MSLKLAYMGIEATDLKAWRTFASVIGFHIEEADDALLFRLDEKARRIIVRRSSEDDYAYCGWDAGSSEAYAARIDRLRAGGVEVTEGDAFGARERAVEGYATFVDPNGFRQEIAYGIQEAKTPFKSEFMKDGFSTGDGGFGHILVKVADYRASEAFALRFLDGKISDHIDLGQGAGRTEMVFIHMNERHHSVAFFEGAIPASKKIHHFMVETPTFEDVGRAYDRVNAAGIPIGVSIGQHSNDRELSFYCVTPSGFWLEVGAGGVRIDDATWSAGAYDSVSSWGHKFGGAK
ncbi:2,3-dihydroxybiphenyl 1,2-dioxygenase [Bradyrhizobium elkanii]|uniref:VOC family protein n=1 Tax=Bradyrhizobium elkanii TaxID=29448 RepID=UPI003512B15A